MHTDVPALHLAVVDPHPVVREGLKALLAPWPHGRVVLAAANCAEYAREAPAAPPLHIALVGLGAHGCDGAATLQWMADHQPHTLPLVLCADPQPTQVHRALLAGARGVLCKSADMAALHTALDHLRATGHHHGPLVQQLLLQPHASGSALALHARAEKLFSKRQRQFLRLYLREEELSLAEVARRMGISRHTAETYRKQVVDKTGARSRFALLRFAQRFGLE